MLIIWKERRRISNSEPNVLFNIALMTILSESRIQRTRIVEAGRNHSKCSSSKFGNGLKIGTNHIIFCVWIILAAKKVQNSFLRQCLDPCRWWWAKVVWINRLLSWCCLGNVRLSWVQCMLSNNLCVLFTPLAGHFKKVCKCLRGNLMLLFGFVRSITTISNTNNVRAKVNGGDPRTRFCSLFIVPCCCCCACSVTSISGWWANNLPYKSFTRYSITVIQSASRKGLSINIG